MKKLYVLLVVSICFCSCRAANEHLDREGIVPRPAMHTVTEGAFVFTPQTVWELESQEQRAIAELFIEELRQASLFSQEILVGNDNARGEGSVVRMRSRTDMPRDAYRMIVLGDSIVIEAGSDAGFFYATQSLRQMMPQQMHSGSKISGVEWSVPCGRIDDVPRFDYRGMMVDVSRYFIPKENILKLLDQMALLKLNKFHWHLIDDQGWRLEIKSHPKLTEVGAWRVERAEPFSGRRNQLPGEKATVGGFYTQQDVREIVAYAAARQIEVIPEIEMPAHTMSSLAAYPELACPVTPKPITVPPGMGTQSPNIIYCAGNDKVFEMLEDVIDEVAELFPSNYIHIGGDEANKTYWKICPLCQKRMKDEGIQEIEQLQSYFIRRMDKYIVSKGKQTMGWDELTHSDMPEGVVIFGWEAKGKRAFKAGEMGHKFVMTPARVLYMIRYQGPQWFEPRTYFGNNTLLDVYNYEPVTEDMPEAARPNLWGVQGSLWCEFVTSAEDAEYLLFPRMSALAEVAWCEPQRKDWANYLTRLDNLTLHYDQMGLNYARSMFNLDHKVESAQGKLAVTISSIRPDMEIRYTTDGTEPTAQSHLYTEPIVVETAMEVRANTFRGSEAAGQTLVLPLNFNLATARKVKSDRKAELLTNGLRGSDKHTDFEYVAWYNQDFAVEVDLGEVREFSTVEIGTITNNGMAVHIPAAVEVAVSQDGVNYETLATKEYSPEEIFTEKIAPETLQIKDLKGRARFVKLSIRNPGVCPDDHTRMKTPTNVHLDEIIIR